MFGRKKAQEDNRFYVKHKDSISKIGDVSIIVDRETGINYINVSIGNGNGLTVLLDEEGNPVRDQT